MTLNIDKPVTRVAVIGAGAAGLAQLQQLQEAWERGNVQSKLELVAFETKEDVGGVWLWDGASKNSLTARVPGKDGDRVYSYPPGTENPSPMYTGLRTNIPAPLMAYRGFEFPEGTHLFPESSVVLKYLQDFATAYNLRQYVRFNTHVERVHLSPSGSSRRWTIESVSSKNAEGEKRREEFDFVSVSNGHYADGWIPSINGLSTFPGEIVHSRYYHSPPLLAPKTILIVGSFASGGDISRLIAGGATAHTPASESAWGKYLKQKPLVSHIDPPSPTHPKGVIHFQPPPSSEDGTPVPVSDEQIDDVDLILFATGYNFAYPFFKSTDRPWDGKSVVDGVIGKEERQGGDEREVGGLKGLTPKNLDELLMFHKGDRSLAFLVLPYQMVPFPFAQVQARLSSLLWAGLLPSFPAHPTLPPNASNPYQQEEESPAPVPASNPDPTASETSTPGTSNTYTTSSAETPSKPSTRKMMQVRRQLLFGAPYEWDYSEFLMGIMAEADAGEGGEGKKVEEHWKRIEPFRRELREQTDLKKRTLGY
ncbi:hypothetical protein L198_07619 [Cryptococcus wingfieldii CBS 7118]|uniref:Monooxygenase n=1 Tax=Cryptococcus wingfieldii CBS 7118 TaxID=1295528 RepID=A0A1E3I5T5_9TREE|nr:hypothetical protein L198_07619 [Cryptococcus wingfieldii CBS 7118]ODN83922.1 hypothetical protein L198_07619 [Cryptococcus wingfieldii CBS 7118]